MPNLINFCANVTHHFSTIEQATKTLRAAKLMFPEASFVLSLEGRFFVIKAWDANGTLVGTI